MVFNKNNNRYLQFRLWLLMLRLNGGNMKITIKHLQLQVISAKQEKLCHIARVVMNLTYTYMHAYSFVCLMCLIRHDAVTLPNRFYPCLSTKIIFCLNWRKFFPTNIFAVNLPVIFKDYCLQRRFFYFFFIFFALTWITYHFYFFKFLLLNLLSCL